MNERLDKKEAGLLRHGIRLHETASGTWTFIAAENLTGELRTVQYQTRADVVEAAERLLLVRGFALDDDDEDAAG